MQKSGTSGQASEPPAGAAAPRSASTPVNQETVEEAVARVRAMPSFLEEIGPEAIARFQREVAEYPEVYGRLPPIKSRKPGR